MQVIKQGTLERDPRGLWYIHGSLGYVISIA